MFDIVSYFILYNGNNTLGTKLHQYNAYFPPKNRLSFVSRVFRGLGKFNSLNVDKTRITHKILKQPQQNIHFSVQGKHDLNFSVQGK